METEPCAAIRKTFQSILRYDTENNSLSETTKKKKKSPFPAVGAVKRKCSDSFQMDFFTILIPSASVYSLKCPKLAN